MHLEGIIWLQSIVEKLTRKHHVETYEVEELLTGKARFRLVEKGSRKGENVYMALGQTDSGRYLKVLLIHKRTKDALILTAMEMSHNERKRYGKK
jgi:uncharacterized DUF497 family protein